MRTWDYGGFPIGLFLTPLETISFLKMTHFFQNMSNFDFEINRPIWPIFMKKSQGKLCMGIFDPNPWYRTYP